MHLVSVDLDLMCSNDRQEIVLLQDLLDWLQSKLETAFSLDVLGVLEVPGLLVAAGIGPEEITEEARKWWLNEPINLVDIFHSFQLW